MRHTQAISIPASVGPESRSPAGMGLQPDLPWNSRRSEELAEVSAGKPLGSRAVLLLDLDFSFLRSERKAETQGQRSPAWARGCPHCSLLPAARVDVLVQIFFFLGIFLIERQYFSVKHSELGGTGGADSCPAAPPLKTHGVLGLRGKGQGREEHQHSCTGRAAAEELHGRRYSPG